MLKKGDKVRINPNTPTPNSFYWNPKRMHKTPGQIGVIVEIDQEVSALKVELENKAAWWYAPSDLEKITEETIMIPELKFEIGKKYKLSDYCNNPYIYLDDAHKHGFEIDSRHAFRDCDGDIIEVGEEDLENIEEYREPYKKTIEGWVGYCNKPLRDDAIGALLFNSEASDYIKPIKTAVSDTWKNKMHVRITLEEIPHD